VHAVVKHERLASRRLYVPQRDQPLSQAFQALSRPWKNRREKEFSKIKLRI
jgi:hypothetical protein